MAHQEVKMITENKTCTQPQQLSASACAEARGFEPRMGANPNRISSSDRGRSDRFKLDQRP